MQQGFIHAECLDRKIMEAQVFGRLRFSAGNQKTKAHDGYKAGNGFHLAAR
jgi:hypothetical protein